MFDLLAETHSIERLEGFVFQLLLQLGVIIAAAQAGGWLFRRLGQPRVVGEILAGLILGPSCLGLFFPNALTTIFPDSQDQQLRLLGQIGLVLLMFDVGLAFNFSHLKSVKSTAFKVALAGILLPFGSGLALAYAMHPYVANEFPVLPFSLFVATAISITAIPVLGRIMLDMKIEGTPIGVLTISAAAFDDAIGWIVLAIVSGLVAGGFQVSTTLWQLTMLTLFVAGSIFIVRPVADYLSAGRDWNTSGDPVSRMAFLLLAVIVFALLTNLIGVFSVFGPFVLGACLSHRPEIQSFYRNSSSNFVAAFFLPVFFTFTGLRTNIGALTMDQWGWCAAIFAVACLGKMLGCGLVTRWSGYSWRESSAVAVMMNTRALMGLVAINVGRDLGAIPDSVFSMLVVMAIGTTVMTVPILRHVLPTDPVA